MVTYHDSIQWKQRTKYWARGQIEWWINWCIDLKRERVMMPMVRCSLDRLMVLVGGEHRAQNDGWDQMVPNGIQLFTCSLLVGVWMEAVEWMCVIIKSLTTTTSLSARVGKCDRGSENLKFAVHCSEKLDWSPMSLSHVASDAPVRWFVAVGTN